MNVKTLISQLQKMDPEQEVMFHDPNHDSIYSVNRVEKEKCNPKDYPANWHMPKRYCALKN